MDYKRDESTTYNISNKFLTNTNSFDVSSPLDDNFKLLNEEYLEKFLNVIKREELEDGFLSNSELLYTEIAKKYGFVLATNFINSIHKTGLQNNDLKITLSILKIISNIKNEIEIDNFSIITLSLFSHKNIEIIDGAISCFEKWGRKSDAELLKNFNVPDVPWLKEYFDKTISYLEGL